MLQLLLAGGPFMFATLAVSLVAMAIAAQKCVFLWGRGAARPPLLAQVLSAVEARDVPQALRACGSDTSPLSNILRAALQRAHRSEKEIRRGIENVALEEVPRIRGGTLYLPQLSNLATLCGLIGTIHGLIVSFAGVSAAGAATRQAALSRGISIAFYNTFFGLVVATLAVVLYLLLLRRTNSIMAHLERGAAQVLDTILLSREAEGRS